MKLLAVLVALLLPLLLSPVSVSAIECGEAPPSGNGHEAQIKEYIDKCISKIDSLKGAQKTLQQTIVTLNSKINLAQAQINQTQAQIEALEKDIKVLTGVLETVNVSLDQLATIYIARVQESYRRYRYDPTNAVFLSQNFGDFMTRLKYINTVKARDQLILTELERSRVDYDEKKNTKITKQQEIQKLKDKVTAQKKDLDAQQRDKSILLKETQNDEKKFQQYLVKAKAELEAIEAIIAGKGQETEVGKTNEGDKIANIISGASACSNGSHLHFEVVKDKIHHDPSSFLKNTSVIWNNDPDGPLTFSGSWNWPLDGKIRITQGYGHTAYSARYRNQFHTGIDIISDNLSVKAIKAGTLYRGSIACGGGTLKYVHIRQQEDNYDSYYLHINYF